MVERRSLRSLTEGRGFESRQPHTRCEAVAQKKPFLRSCRHIVMQDCDECRWNYIVNMRVPGSNPGDVGNDVVAQLAEHHEEFHHHLSSQDFQTPSALGAKAAGLFINQRLPAPELRNFYSSQ